MMKQVVVTLPPVSLLAAFQYSQSTFPSRGSTFIQNSIHRNFVTNMRQLQMTCLIFIQQLQYYCQNRVIMQLSRALTKRMATKFAATALMTHWMTRQQEEQKQGQWQSHFLQGRDQVTSRSPGESKHLIGSVESIIFNLIEFMEQTQILLIPAVLNFRFMLYCM